MLPLGPLAFGDVNGAYFSPLEWRMVLLAVVVRWLGWYYSVVALAPKLLS